MQCSIRSVLEENALLRVLSQSARDELSLRCQLASAGRGDALWIYHKDTSFVGLIGSGFVKMVKTYGPGLDTTLEIFGPGEMFGLLGTIRGVGCPLKAFALTDLEYVQIPKSEILDLYRTNHELKDKLLVTTASRIHQKLDYVSRLSSSKVEERIAAVLFLLAESYGRPLEKAIRLEVPLTRQQLAEIAGTTTETTIRVFSKWSSSKWVDTEHQFITILEPARLERMLQ